MGTKEELSIEELGAEVSSSVLTPLRFLERSARVWRDRPAVVDGKQTWTYAEHDERVRRAAAARARRARRSARATASRCCSPTSTRCSSCTTPSPASAACSCRSTRASRTRNTTTSSSTAARRCSSPIASSTPTSAWSRSTSTRSCVEAADPVERLERPEDERTMISINYTSGTTGKPKGVMTNHRGAYLHALGVIAEARLTPRSSLPVDAADVPLQRLGLSVGGHRDGRQARLPPQGGGEADLERAHQGGHHAPVRRADGADHDRRRRRGREARRARRRCSSAARRRRPRCWSKGAKLNLAHHPPLRADRDLRPARGLRLEPRLGRARPTRSRRSCAPARASAPSSPSACASSTRT